jgi:hypothetical protein
MVVAHVSAGGDLPGRPEAGTVSPPRMVIDYSTSSDRSL